MKLSQWINQVTSNNDAILTIEKSEDRIKRAYTELLSGYNQNPSNILNNVVHVENYNGVVIENGIRFTSICGHHFLPFFGSIDIIYEPGRIITGLGKLPRLVQAYARRLQIQELLVKEIAEEIMKTIGAKGVFVRARATHLCMHSRGPSDRNVETVCVYSIGTLKNKKWD
ncbi:MAG: GTP cyclohydrolase I [Candidatus Woesearchaeota archaeon]